MKTVGVREMSGEFMGEPLVIAGPGPSYDLVDWSRIPDVHVFALNHSIVDLYRRRQVWWVSNDHDRTFQNSHIRSVMLPRLKRYRKWRTITQRLFIPGALGDFDWVDHKGRPQKPMKWRLQAPAGSDIYHYVSGPNMTNHPEWIYNGHSVLELALTVATLWGFSPIVCVGTDMAMESAETYYAKPFRFKDCPRRVVRVGMNHAQRSVRDNRHRWAKRIGIVSDLWTDSPFDRVHQNDVMEYLGAREHAEGPYSEVVEG